MTLDNVFAATTEPLFAAPWEAEVFALAVSLAGAGCYTWGEWIAALAGELKLADQSGAPRDGSRYYDAWLAALEKLLAAKDVLDVRALADSRADWIEAYRTTPHGHPVVLSARASSSETLSGRQLPR